MKKVYNLVTRLTSNQPAQLHRLKVRMGVKDKGPSCCAKARAYTCSVAYGAKGFLITAYRSLTLRRSVK